MQIDLSKLVTQDSGISFKGDDFRLLCGPIVYTFLLEGVPLYVGMSRNGLERPGKRDHKQATLARALCDEVRIWRCPSNAAAFALERLIIQAAKPKYNHRNVKGRWQPIDIDTVIPLHHWKVDRLLG